MISLLAEQDGAVARVRLQDNGISITEEMLSRIFGLFTQVEDLGDRSEGGLGIELALV